MAYSQRYQKREHTPDACHDLHLQLAPAYTLPSKSIKPHDRSLANLSAGPTELVARGPPVGVLDKPEETAETEW